MIFYKGELPDSAIKVREHNKNLFELCFKFFLFYVLFYMFWMVEYIDIMIYS